MYGSVHCTVTIFLLRGDAMYNKIFTKILDSSIWLAPDPHRLVWITLIAAMDEDGNAMFASVRNLAARARVSVDDCQAAVDAFMSPDPDSGDPDNEGRRIEHFPGGWHVLNAQKYKSIVTRAVARENTRLRVAAWRERNVTKCNAQVTKSNVSVTPSYTETETETETELTIVESKTDSTFVLFWQAYPKKADKKKSLKAWAKLSEEKKQLAIADCKRRYAGTEKRFIPNPTTYINGERWEDELLSGPLNPEKKKSELEKLSDAIHRRRNDIIASA